MSAGCFDNLTVYTTPESYRQAAKVGKTVLPLPAGAGDTTQKCGSCGAKAKSSVELSERVFSW